MKLTIEKLSFGPGAIAHSEDGRTIFVAGGVPGDTVEASVYEEKKHVAFASIDTVLEKGPHHVNAPCPYVGRCGGCPWGNVSQELQRKAKVQNLRDALLRLAKLDEATVDSVLRPLVELEKPWGYRNKIELSPDPTSARFALGMHGLNPLEFVPLMSCHLLPKPYQALPKKITGALSYALGTNATCGANKSKAGALPYAPGSNDPGRANKINAGANSYVMDATAPERIDTNNPARHISRVGIRASEKAGSLEIALWGSPCPLNRNRVADILREATGATSIVRCLTKGSMKERRVSKVEVLSGKGFWEEEIDHRRMRFSAPSFAQANTAGAEKLIHFVQECLKEENLGGEHLSGECLGAEVQHPVDASVSEAHFGPVDSPLARASLGAEDSPLTRVSLAEKDTLPKDAFDLYAGAGTFTLPLAERCAFVSAVESSGFAVRDLRRNVENAGLENVVIQGGDAAREFPSLPPEEKPDVILTDPPRAGLDERVIRAISEAGAKMFIYVSCDIQTLARDIQRILDTGAWNLVCVQPFEMFGQTYHTETIAVFKKASAEKH